MKPIIRTDYEYLNSEWYMLTQNIFPNYFLKQVLSKVCTTF